jgi:hypothetical protein
VQFNGECFLKSGSAGEVAFSEFGWQSFWRQQGQTSATCATPNCNSCLADGTCVRCNRGFVFAREGAC